MNTEQFGPFANIVAIASALVAVFGVLLLKMLGGLKRWVGLGADSPPFLVAAGSRVLAVALMAVTYITINSTNYRWFGLVAVATGVLGFLAVLKFDRLRKLHVVAIPLVGANGKQMQDEHGELLFRNVVIGSEKELRREAAVALKAARAMHAVTLSKFMSGYGSPVNDPESLWDRDHLVDTASRLTAALMHVVLLAVMTMFLAAFAIEVAGRGEG
jgi:hypothetical protein